MLDHKIHFDSHLGAFGIQTSGFVDRDSLIVDVCYQIGDELGSFPPEGSRQFSGNRSRPDRQISDSLCGPIAGRLNLYLISCLPNCNRNRTNRSTLSCGLAAGQIHGPGSGEVRKGLGTKAERRQTYDATTPYQEFHTRCRATEVPLEDCARSLENEVMSSLECINIVRSARCW